VLVSPLARTDVALPPGPPLPRLAQGVITLANRRVALRELRKRYGPDFTVDVPIFGRNVVISDPANVRAIFKSPPEQLDTIDQSLGRVMGPNSLFALRADEHRIQRKILVPPFHGRRLKAHEQLIERETLAELARWPHGVPVESLPSMMRITLNVILRAVFGANGSQLERLRTLIPVSVALGSLLAIVPVPRWERLSFAPWGRLARYRREYDAVVDELIAIARADDALGSREDMLAMMLQSRYDDGASMSRDQLADQLLTVLTAGYETTATTLAWAIERISRHPIALERLVAETERGESEFMTATILEVQRTRPVIDCTFRSVAAPFFELGDWNLPRLQPIVVSIGLVHTDESVFPNHERFDPDRFITAKPDVNQWIPYGGGARRCLGAAFATMELKVVLQTLLRAYTLVPTTEPAERFHSRGVAFAPHRGGRAVVLPRAIS